MPILYSAQYTLHCTEYTVQYTIKVRTQYTRNKTKERNCDENYFVTKKQTGSEFWVSKLPCLTYSRIVVKDSPGEYIFGYSRIFCFQYMSTVRISFNNIWLTKK